MASAIITKYLSYDKKPARKIAFYSALTLGVIVPLALLVASVSSSLLFLLSMIGFAFCPIVFVALALIAVEIVFSD